MKVSEAFEKFIYQKRLAGLKETSISDYRFQLERFFKFVGSCADVSAISQNTVERYIISVNHSSLSKGTKHSYIRVLRIFLSFLARECECDSVQPAKIVIPKMPKKTVKIYSNDEILMIFRAIRNSIPWLEVRDKAIVALMLDSGLRQMEVSGLMWHDIQFREMTMVVHGKGDKERYVPLGNTSVYLLNEYASLCPFEKNEYVFRALDGSVITNNALKLMIGRIHKHLPFELSSHKLRHNFATNYCINQYEKRGQIDSLSLQAIMGHESLQTTDKYIHTAMSLMAARYCDSRLDTLELRLLSKIK